jgi:competence protein ComEC
VRRTLLLVWALALGAAVGAVVAAERPQLSRASLVAVVLAIFLGSIRRRPFLAVASVVLAGVGCGALAASLRAAEGAALQNAARVVPRCTVVGRILEEVGALGTLATIEVAGCDHGVGRLDEGVVAIETDALAGSPYRATGWLVPLGSDGFDAALARAGADARLSGTVETSSPQGWHKVAATVRRGLWEAAARSPGEERALLLGLSVGDTAGLTQDTLGSFRRSGLSHLVAVSGSNVAIVLGAAALAVRRMTFMTRISAAVITLAVFVNVVGPDASVLRAAAMGALAIMAVAFGRQVEPLHALGLALAFLVVVRPQLVFSVGLHLSAAATAGIILWTCRLERRATWLPGLVRLPLAVTLAAQAAVAPLLLGIFGEVSVVAPVTNLLAAAAVPPATIAGFLAALVSPLWPSLGSLVLALGEPFAGWILLVGRVGSAPSWATLELPPQVGFLLALAVTAAVVITLPRYGRAISLDA